MMTLTLRIGESVTVGDVTIHLKDLGEGRGGHRISLGIDAPRDMHIGRVLGQRDGYDHSDDDDLLAAMMGVRG